MTYPAGTGALEEGHLANIDTNIGNIAGGGSTSDLSTTGTISAAQSGINTPVSNATVVLATGKGQSSWKAQLLAGGGGFTSGTTIVADKSVDGGTTWYSASFKVTGASPATTVSSVVGPGPLELTGNAAGVTHVRIRCSVLNSTETIAVTLRASTGVGDIGLMSSIPAGSNTIGGVNVVDSAGTNKLGVDSGGRTTNVIQAVAGAALAADQSNTELRASLYGKNSTAGDTPLLLNSDGSIQADLRKVLGAVLSNTNPLLIESNIQNWIRNGQGYKATYRNTSASNITVGLSIFNASNSGKNVLIYSVRPVVNVSMNPAASAGIYLTTTDPALGTSVTPLNSLAGGSASVTTCSSSNTTVSPAGTLYASYGLIATTPYEILTSGQTILLPSGSAHGIAVYVVANTAAWSIDVAWVEY